MEGTAGTPSAGPVDIKMEQDSNIVDAPMSSTPSNRQETPVSHPTPPPATMTSRLPEATAANTTNGKLMLPKTAAHHGAPTRDWINTHVTGVLLEGMKLLATERPEAPLHALGTYLIKRSAEIEGKSGVDGGEEHS